jgi:mono/diheme cytochrome c family protein
MTARLLALLLVILVLPAAAASAQDKAPAGNAARGKQLFAADGCYECHGYAGQGARPTGPRVARTELPYSAFVQQLRQPAAEMPPYTAKVLPSKDVADIFAYLQSLPAPPAPKDVAILQN